MDSIKGILRKQFLENLLEGSSPVTCFYVRGLEQRIIYFLWDKGDIFGFTF